MVEARDQVFRTLFSPFAFISAPVQATAVTDENAGGWEEYAMLKLRLTEGLTYAEAERFGKASELRRNASELPSALVNAGTDGISLTPEGFLVSNAVIGELLYREQLRILKMP